MRLATATLLSTFAILTVDHGYAQTLEQTGGPPGMRIADVIELPDGLLATGGVGAFRLEDKVWRYVPTAARIGRVARLGDLLFAWQGYNGTFLRSDDLGANWSPLVPGTVLYVSEDALYVRATVGGIESIYATKDGTAYRNLVTSYEVVDDDGKSTEKTLSFILEAAVAESEVLWVIAFSEMGSGPYRSEDGATWTVRADGLPAAPDHLYSLTGSVYASVAEQLYVYEEGNQAWSNVDGGWSGSIERIEATPSDLYVTIRSSNGRTVYRRSVAIWEEIPTPDPSCFAVTPNDERLMIVCDRGVYEQEGEAWALVSEGLVASYGIPYRAGANRVLARLGPLPSVLGPSLNRSTEGFAASDDGGTTWRELDVPDDLRDVFDVRGELFGTGAQDVYRSIDGGQTWQTINAGIVAHPKFDFGFSEIVEGGGEVYGSLRSGRFASHTGGQSEGGVFRWNAAQSRWEHLLTGYPVDPARGFRASVRGIAATSEAAVVSTTVGLYRRTHEASSWAAVSFPGAPAGFGALHSVGDDLIVETSDGPFLSVDHGLTWTLARTGLPEDAFYQFDYYTVGDRLIARHRRVENADELYDLNGETWTRSTVTVPEWLEWEDVVAVGENAYFGTWNHGLWSVPLSAFGVENEPESAVSEGLRSAPPYPNPVREQATLRLSQRRAAPVRVEVFDMRGRRVKVLHNGVLPSEAALSLDTSGLVAGLYIVWVEGEGLSVTHRLTVLP